MRFETPGELAARLKLGREEFMQRLLTTLILHAPYPSWNTAKQPSESGLEFLELLYQSQFDDGWPGGAPVFVDECELPARSDDERGAAPDYAVIWPDRIWIIELKSERASHRPDQLPYYFELAHHHHPGRRVDLTYLTPPMSAHQEAPGDWARFSHTTWDDVVPIVRKVWRVTGSESQQAVVEGLIHAIDKLGMPAAEWRATMAPSRAEEPVLTSVAPTSTVTPALDVVDATASDGQQRAFNAYAGDLDDLLELRLQVREAVVASAPSSPRRHVVPWIWKAATTDGSPMTDAGRESGMELRFSRYRKPKY